MMFSHRSAFSLIETLVVITLLAIAAGFSVLYAQSSTVRTDLRTQAALFAAELRETQTDALSGKWSGAGIHVAADRYVVFQGSSYDPAAATNSEVLLPAAIAISNISLAGGGSDIVFVSPLGEVAAYGSLDFVSSSIGQTVHVSINSLGVVSYE